MNKNKNKPYKSLQYTITQYHMQLLAVHNTFYDVSAGWMQHKLRQKRKEYLQIGSKLQTPSNTFAINIEWCKQRLGQANGKCMQWNWLKFDNNGT